MNDRRALMATIIANPADDAPRLVLADWLQEYGDEHDQARAEFIRLQVEASHLPEKDRQHKKRMQQAQQILKRHRETWLAPLAAIDHRHLDRIGNDVAYWSRGLFQELFIPKQTFLLKAAQQALPDVLADLGVETIRFSRASTKRVTAITDSPALAWVSGVILEEGDNAFLNAFGQSPTCTQLTSFEFADSKATDTGLRDFAMSTTMRQLRRFAVPLGAYWQPKRKYTAAGVVAVIESPRLPLLDTLDLAGKQQAKFAYETLLASPQLKRLVLLKVGGNVPMSLLVASSHLTALQELTIESSSITDQDVEVLLANRALKQLAQFTLWNANEGTKKLSRSSIKKLRDRFGTRLEVGYSINAL